jgi:Flp pilus assembly protein TadD
VELDPAYRYYRQQLALAYGELARFDDSYLPLALAQQELVYNQSNSYPPDASYLACLYWQSDQPERATELMHRAASIAPLNFHTYFTYHLSRLTFYFNLGHYLESVGENDLAQQAYAQVLLAFPQAGTSPYWHVSEDRHQMLQASAGVAQQLTDNKNLSAEIAFYSDDYQTALELFAVPPLDQIGRVKSLLALGQLETAGKLLATEGLQSSARFLPYHAQVLMARGDLAQAETEIQKAIALSRLDSSMILQEPSYYYRWGSLAEMQGNTSLAEVNYKRAIAVSTTIQTVYANLAWNRQPMPTEQPFCLMIPYPAENLSQPSLALADLMMSQNDPSGAAEVLENLLRHEPYHLEVQRRLRELITTYPTLQPESLTGPGQ